MPIYVRDRRERFTSYAAMLKERFNNGILAELQPLPQWVVWRAELVDRKTKKIPYNPRLHLCRLIHKFSPKRGDMRQKKKMARICVKFRLPFLSESSRKLFGREPLETQLLNPMALFSICLPIFQEPGLVSQGTEKPLIPRLVSFCIAIFLLVLHSKHSLLLLREIITEI